MACKNLLLQLQKIRTPLRPTKHGVTMEEDLLHTHTNTHNHFTAVWILSGTPTHTCRGHQSSLICFFHLIRSMASSHEPDSLFPQSLSKFSLVYLLAWHPQLHAPYISSPNHCLLFATRAHTIATCFAVVPRLCDLILVSLSTLYLEFYFVASCHTSILPFSSLPAEVPPHFPFLQARSHFHTTYYFAHNCRTVSLSLLKTDNLFIANHSLIQCNCDSCSLCPVPTNCFTILLFMLQ